MEASGQHKAPVPLRPGKDPVTLWVGGYVVSRAGLYVFVSLRFCLHNTRRKTSLAVRTSASVSNH